MDIDEQETPQKSKSWSNYMETTTPQSNSSNGSVCSHSSQMKLTPNSSNVGQETSHIQIMTTAMVSTPPAKRFQYKVKNPFEVALAESLHLPLIGSPSLFQRPTAPQLSSTHFEWTIDQVSSLLPVNVEPHETQFQDSPDPDFEARAQLAISSYFKEQQIVPSPVDCPLRNNRIILSELNANTPISKPGRRIRDYGTQTELSLPFHLPKELEEALKPYLQPHLAGVGKEFKRIGYRPRISGNENIKDVSLRRKLFDMQNVVIVGGDDSPLKMDNNLSETNDYDKSSSPMRVSIIGKLSDSLDKSICSSLSPMSTYHDLSFLSHSPAQSSPTKRKTRLKDFCEELSPILPDSRRSIRRDENKSASKDKYLFQNISELMENDGSPTNLRNPIFNGSKQPEFALDRSSSPLIPIDNQIGNFSTDSFNVKVSRLAVSNNCKPLSNESQAKSRMEAQEEVELFLPDETNEVLDDDEDDMQVSQLSLQSSNCSSTNSDTPRKRRSASRKNLSQSFSASWLQTDDVDDYEMPKINTPPKILVVQSEGCAPSKKVDTKEGAQNFTKLGDNQKVSFYRTDSGFNEMTSSSSVTSSQDEHSRDTAPTPSSVGFLDANMQSCQTN